MTTQELKEILCRILSEQQPGSNPSSYVKLFELCNVEFMWIEASFYEALPELYQRALKFKNVAIGPADELLRELSAIAPETNWRKTLNI